MLPFFESTSGSFLLRISPALFFDSAERLCKSENADACCWLWFSIARSPDHPI